jgi:hypothetical protein
VPFLRHIGSAPGRGASGSRQAGFAANPGDIEAKNRDLMANVLRFGDSIA